MTPLVTSSNRRDAIQHAPYTRRRQRISQLNLVRMWIHRNRQGNRQVNAITSGRDATHINMCTRVNRPRCREVLGPANQQLVTRHRPRPTLRIDARVDRSFHNRCEQSRRCAAHMPFATRAESVSLGRCAGHHPPRQTRSTRRPMRRLAVAAATRDRCCQIQCLGDSTRFLMN